MKLPKGFELKRDKYSDKRGGNSKVLMIRCKQDNFELALYQKDGPGPLKRLYLDRVIEPSLKAGHELVCKKCKQQVAVPYIYADEKRQALMIEAGSITQQVIPRSAYGK